MRLARLHYSEDSLPTLTSGKLHVLLELPDHLGSSSIVVDKETGELAERSTYQAYGGADSDYRPDRWGSFREDYRFTGKEEDAEVGLDYFGKRYLAVGLNRWLSADPLAVHAPGSADLNLYAYVHGAVLKSVDPLGLTDVDRQASQQQATSTSSSPMPMLKAGMDKLVAGWGSFRTAVTNLVKSDDFDSNYDQSKKLQAVNVPEPIKGLNDGLMEHTPGATVNLGLIAVAGMQGGAPVRVSNTPAGGAGAPTGGSPPPTSLPRAAADGVGGTGAGVAGTKPIAPPPPADPVAPPPAKLPDAIGKSGTAQADVNAFADAAGKALKEGAGGEHGPFIHGINKGGLSDIIRTQQMIASDARMSAGGASGVRAYTTSLDKLGPHPSTDFLEFTTEKAPTATNHGQSSVSWGIEAGGQLDIRVSRIAHADGTVTIFFP